MPDVSRERERREAGTYEEPTPIFRSMMASRSASPAAVLPAIAAQPPVPTLAVPATNAPVDTAKVRQAIPTVTAPAGSGVIPPGQDKVEETPTSVTHSGLVSKPTGTSTPDTEIVSAGIAADNDDTAFRIKLRPPRLENIDLRDLSMEMKEVVSTKPRGITLVEGIQLMKKLKFAGYVRG